MSPPAWHEYAWTQLPPWQLVEQQSEPTLQALPRVVQLETVAGKTWQVPDAHRPEQHWLADEQVAPVVAQAPDAVVWAAHFPETQLRLQHWVFELQTAPWLPQKPADVHVPYAQLVEQHCESTAQVSPPGLQAAVVAVPHFPEVQRPEQHCEGDEQVEASARQADASMQVPDAHACEQQFESAPQAWPTALHAVGSTQVPVHALLQHSEAWAQVVPSGAQLVVAEPHRPVVALH